MCVRLAVSLVMSVNLNYLPLEHLFNGKQKKCLSRHTHTHYMLPHILGDERTQTSQIIYTH